MDFPLFNTKKLSTKNIKYNLSDPTERKKYFNEKAGKEIEEIKTFLEKDGFLAIMLAKKSAGKGTYSKMFAEIVGEEKVAHISIGDIVRDIHSVISKKEKNSEEIIKYIEQNYRGITPLQDALDAFINRTQDKLIPTEFILTLVKRSLENVQGKAIFLDGFPRNLDQISYSLYFRQIMNLTVGPDFFVLIDVPETVIDERMKYRLVCPTCNTSRNIKLLPTKFVYEKTNKSGFGLICDNPACKDYEKVEMVSKEGDEMGIDPIRKRLEMDGELIEKVSLLYGVPKILVRNSIPENVANDYADNYEITPAFSYKKNGEKVETIESPWIIKNDAGVDSISLMAPAALLSMIYQLHSQLIKNKNYFN